MKRLVVCLSVLSCAALAQQAPPKLEFEVASVKPAQPMPMGQMRVQMNSDAGILRYTNVSLKDCIRVAYRVKEFQVEGPDWLENTRFDIQAKLPDGATKDEIPEMLQTLLADRFKLVVHRDTKKHAIYALVVAKGRSKPETAEVSRGPVGDGKKATSPGGLPKGGMFVQMNPGGTHLRAMSITLPSFAEILSRFCERPVMDMTGIQGQYDFDLSFTPDAMRGIPGPKGGGPMPPPPMAGGDGGGPVLAGGGERGPGAADVPTEAGGSIFDAVQHYGLKLEPKKAPMEIVLVDHVERMPTEN